MKCKLCRGTGENQTGITMRVNNGICPRCGGYGTVPDRRNNTRAVNDEDRGYIRCNGGDPGCTASE